MKGSKRSEDVRHFQGRWALMLCLFVCYSAGLLRTIPVNNPNSSGDIVTKMSNKDEFTTADMTSEIHVTDIHGPLDTEVAASACMRICPPHVRHQNAIIFLGPEGAGLKDARNIIKHMLKYAGYLCATLYIPPPHFQLGAQHNDNNYVDTSIRWSDFFDFRFKQDDSVAVFDLEAARNFTHESTSKDDSRNVERFVERLFPHGPNPFRLKSLNPSEVRRDFLAAEKFVKQQIGDDNMEQRFVWEIRKNFYVYRKQLAEALEEVKRQSSEQEELSLPYNCEYTQPDTVPNLIRTISTNVWERIRQKYPDSIYGTMHVRRGDTVEWCDTSVRQLKKFLACSFNGTAAFGQSFTILFQSDERDITYRDQVKALIEDLGVQFVDLDLFVRQEIMGKLPSEMHDNYYTFAVIKAFDAFVKDGTFQYPGYPEISKHMFFAFRHHKHICPRCSPLAYDDRLNNKLKKGP